MTWLLRGSTAIAAVVAAFLVLPALADTAADDAILAADLAAMLRAGRGVISANQDRINNPALGDKGLSGQVVLDKAVAAFRTATGKDPLATDPASRDGRLLRALMASIAAVMDANQKLINTKGAGFKGFIPAVFARLTGEEFAKRAGGEASIKVTAPPPLVRNRASRPDAWESEVIRTKFLAPGWTAGQPYAARVPAGEHDNFRMAVPEYYAASCLSCHGDPKGSTDITGYPREGGHEGDLGGVISITLSH